MDESTNSQIDSKPAGYPKSSTGELDSLSIFQYLLNKEFVKPDIKALDKFPNIDGSLELTDSENRPIGKLEVQLKTLDPDNYNNPKYPCEKSFFSYCERSPAPVLLVAVDRQNKRVYWRHIDRSTISEVASKITGATYFLPLPKENCLDGNNEDYIQKWGVIVQERQEDLSKLFILKSQNEELERKLAELKPKLHNPVNLPLFALKEIYNFLDKYNYILDHEFAVVKQVKYPEYWKIGIGILKYEFGEVSFILFPVKFEDAQPLVKEVDRSYDFTGLEMLEGRVLMWAGSRDWDCISKYPMTYAYELLDDDILRIAGKVNFPLDDLFLAHEYVISFIDSFHEYLVMPKDADSYSLADLKYLLMHIIPMVAATTRNYADWVVEYDHGIDQYERFRAGKNHQKDIENAKKKIKEGFIPKVKVTVTSTRYNIELIYFYIRALEKKGFRSALRKYKISQRDETIYNVPLWQTWNKQILWENLKLFYEQFYKRYENYIGQHFPIIKDELKNIRSKEYTVIHVLYFDENRSYEPWMRVFHLRPPQYEEGKILCFLDEDPSNPIKLENLQVGKYECEFEGKLYQISYTHGQRIDFMFEQSPTYALINSMLTDRLKKYLRKRISNKNE